MRNVGPRFLAAVVGAALIGTGMFVSSATAAEVRTIAGTGEKQPAKGAGIGDGGPAMQAIVADPFGITVGPDDALYICETTGQRIRRLDLPTGKITTIAGTGKTGYTGDGGPATQATMNEPYEIRFDGEGNLYFVERLNHVVRKIDRDGTISTVAGTGEAGFSGDGGPADRAMLKQPHSICFDPAGRLYICDIGNHRVRRVDLNNGRIETFGGTGEKKPTPDGAPISGTPLNGPRALAVDRQGNLILALREGNAIYRIDLDAERYEHLAGTGKSGYSGDGGPAKRAQLAGPKGVAIAPNGDIMFADTESHTIRSISQEGTIRTLVGNGKPGDGPDGDPESCQLDRPHGVETDSAGRVYIGDSNNHRVRLWTSGQ